MSQDLKKVDWKKPIRSIRTTSEVTFFCMDGDRAICKWKSKSGSVSYVAYNEYGQLYNDAAYVSIENVPPPKISQTMLMILRSDGSICLRNPDWVRPASWGAIIAKKLVTITEGEGLEF